MPMVQRTHWSLACKQAYLVCAIPASILVTDVGERSELARRMGQGKVSLHESH